MLICPGGGFMTRAVDHEGVLIANWFKARGVAGFILRYRIGPVYARNVSIQDAERGIRYLRSHAGDFAIDPNRIGIIGFSAGAMLASSVAMKAAGGHVRRERPDRSGIEPGRLPDSCLRLNRRWQTRGGPGGGVPRPRSRRSQTGKPRRRPSSSAPRKMRI